jgi:hypothetical protein
MREGTGESRAMQQKRYKIDIQFYSDARDALLKAMVE